MPDRKRDFMENTSYKPLLARVGKVLVFIGVVDIGVMIYCIAKGISYSSSFNLFAVIAGAFLMRGSLRAASIVRGLSLFSLGACIALAAAWPFLQPFELTLMEIRSSPLSALLLPGFMIFLCVLLYWIATSLSHETIVAAQRHSGRKPYRKQVLAAEGVGLVAVACIFMSLLLGGDAAKEAVKVAQRELGPGYRFHVSSLSFTKRDGVTSVRGVVRAWNSTELRDVRVAWEER
jgi:hypothetical protein